MNITKRLSSLALRTLAIVFMLIDHIAYTFYYVLPVAPQMRMIGRLALPIFCFLIAEGLFNTKDVRKYILRLGIFAVVSELPFDLMSSLGQRLVDWRYQNVFWTLLLGLAGILFFDIAAAKNRKALALVAILAAAFGAELIRSDYGAVGVLFIFVCYQFRNQPVRLSVMFAVCVLVSAFTHYDNPQWAFITLCEIMSLPLLLMYNGTKGGDKLKAGTQKALQWAFYMFYPAHLLVLAVIRMAFFR